MESLEVFPKKNPGRVSGGISQEILGRSPIAGPRGNLRKSLEKAWVELLELYWKGFMNLSQTEVLGEIFGVNAIMTVMINKNVNTIINNPQGLF